MPAVKLKAAEKSRTIPCGYGDVVGSAALSADSCGSGLRFGGYTQPEKENSSMDIKVLPLEPSFMWGWLCVVAIVAIASFTVLRGMHKEYTHRDNNRKRDHELQLERAKMDYEYQLKRLSGSLPSSNFLLK